jgi:hypothetical protein
MDRAGQQAGVAFVPFAECRIPNAVEFAQRDRAGILGVARLTD